MTANLIDLLPVLIEKTRAKSLLWTRMDQSYVAQIKDYQVRVWPGRSLILYRDSKFLGLPLNQFLAQVDKPPMLQELTQLIKEQIREELDDHLVRVYNYLSGEG